MGRTPSQSCGSGGPGPNRRIPTLRRLDESNCRYLDLSAGDRARFDRATFWLDMTSRQWNISASADITDRARTGIYVEWRCRIAAQ
jgi:hypothetical protein